MRNLRVACVQVQLVIITYSVTVLSLPAGESDNSFNLFSPRKTFSQGRSFLRGALGQTNNFVNNVIKLQPLNNNRQLPEQKRNDFIIQNQYVPPPTKQELPYEYLKPFSSNLESYKEGEPSDNHDNDISPEKYYESNIVEENNLLKEILLDTTTTETDTIEYTNLYSTDGYETTTEDDLLRSGVSDAVAATLLGKK